MKDKEQLRTHFMTSYERMLIDKLTLIIKDEN
jgi:hypothetical protein